VFHNLEVFFWSFFAEIGWLVTLLSLRKTECQAKQIQYGDWDLEREDWRENNILDTQNMAYNFWLYNFQVLTYRYKLERILAYDNGKVYYRQPGFFRFDTDKTMLESDLHKGRLLMEIEQLS
jgi:hypothetical protein